MFVLLFRVLIFRCTLREASLRLSGAILVGLRKPAATAGSGGAGSTDGARRGGPAVLLHPDGRAHALKVHQADAATRAARAAAAGAKQQPQTSSVVDVVRAATAMASAADASAAAAADASRADASAAFALAARGAVEVAWADARGSGEGGSEGLEEADNEAEEEAVIEAGDELVVRTPLARGRPQQELRTHAQRRPLIAHNVYLSCTRPLF